MMYAFFDVIEIKNKYDVGNGFIIMILIYPSNS